MRGLLQQRPANKSWQTHSCQLHLSPIMPDICIKPPDTEVDQDENKAQFADWLVTSKLPNAHTLP